mmetsp:Transcript_46583/g.120596  ORF Transcript_46583/g.120596 Transcript_46583/m.120596 type:complete len:277 (+) Transcript_46583:89-919(+)
MCTSSGLRLRYGPAVGSGRRRNSVLRALAEEAITASPSSSAGAAELLAHLVTDGLEICRAQDLAVEHHRHHHAREAAAPEAEDAKLQRHGQHIRAEQAHQDHGDDLCARSLALQAQATQSAFQHGLHRIQDHEGREWQADQLEGAHNFCVRAEDVGQERPEQQRERANHEEEDEDEAAGGIHHGAGPQGAALADNVAHQRAGSEAEPDRAHEDYEHELAYGRVRGKRGSAAEASQQAHELVDPPLGPEQQRRGHRDAQVVAQAADVSVTTAAGGAQ